MRSHGWGRALGGVAAVLLLALPTAAVHGQGLAGAAQGSTSNVGYIDSAIPTNLFRLRVDAAYDINRSDRAEFIYSPGFDPRIDNQTVNEYVNDPGQPAVPLPLPLVSTATPQRARAHR